MHYKHKEAKDSLLAWSCVDTSDLLPRRAFSASSPQWRRTAVGRLQMPGLARLPLRKPCHD